MERAVREELRRRVDVAVRAGVTWPPVFLSCPECGGERRDDLGRPQYVLGCATCSARRSQYERKHSATAQPREQLTLRVAA